MKNDLFQQMGIAINPINMPGFNKAQSRHDSETPDSYDVVKAENEIDILNSYKKGMELAIEYIRKEIGLYKKAGRFDCADALENEIDEIVCNLSYREGKL